MWCGCIIDRLKQGETLGQVHVLEIVNIHTNTLAIENSSKPVNISSKKSLLALQDKIRCPLSSFETLMRVSNLVKCIL